MKRLLSLFLFVCSVSCSEYIDKPKNLIDKSVMAEILADLAVNDQVSFVYQNKNLESGTRFILKSYNIKSEDFTESYKYYVVKQKMSGIVDEAQKKLLEKDPKADKYVKEKLEKGLNVPVFAK